MSSGFNPSGAAPSSRCGHPIMRRTLLRAAGAGAALAVIGSCSAPAASPPPEKPPHEPPGGPPGGPNATLGAARGGSGAAALELVRSERGRPQVALTFHGAGEPALTRQVLDVLGRGGARVTVLAVGTWLARYPDAAAMVRDGGHELGNHTWSHPVLSALNPAGVRAEIERCRDRLVALTGGPGPFFRPSSTQHATAAELGIAGAAGYPRVLSYDLDSRDWTDPGQRAVRRALASARAGSVVSMHLGHPGTVTALPGILDDLAVRGLAPVTATELFA